MRAIRSLLVATVFVTACKSPTPADQVSSILSWIGTAGLAGDAWLRHTTPDKYTRQTLELSSQTILQISTELEKSPPPSINSTFLDSAFTRTRQHIDEMGRLVQEKNSPAFSVQLDSLRADQRLVKQISDSIEASQ